MFQDIIEAVLDKAIDKWMVQEMKRIRREAKIRGENEMHLPSLKLYEGIPDDQRFLIELDEYCHRVRPMNA